MGYNSSISIQAFIFISLVLLTSITSVPAIQSQSPIQTQTQPSTTVASQIVKEIAEKVATANPGPYATFVEQILTELTRQSAQVSNQGNVLDEIYSQVSTYPYGIVSQLLLDLHVHYLLIFDFAFSFRLLFFQMYQKIQDMSNMPEMPS